MIHLQLRLKPESAAAADSDSEPESKKMASSSTVLFICTERFWRLSRKNDGELSRLLKIGSFGIQHVQTM